MSAFKNLIPGLLLLVLASFGPAGLAAPQDDGQVFKAYDEMHLKRYDIPRSERDAAGAQLVSLLDRNLRGKSVNQVLAHPEWIGAQHGSSMHAMLQFFFERLQSYGYGSGSFGGWNYKYMHAFCGELEQVFYAPLRHGGREQHFGFFLSYGPTFVSPAELAGKRLASCNWIYSPGPECMQNIPCPK